MRKYKIYYRFEMPEKFYSGMKLEQNIEAFTFDEACDKLRDMLPLDGLKLTILEAYEQVYINHENIVLPEDL